jgi:phosphoenolpyruvate synthase/pyruvate phosphate dikinase
MNKEISVPEEKKNEQSISDEIVRELAGIGKKIEAHYEKPQDIEWGIDSQSKIWILQSRPITTL